MLPPPDLAEPASERLARATEEDPDERLEQLDCGLVASCPGLPVPEGRCVDDPSWFELAYSPAACDAARVVSMRFELEEHAEFAAHGGAL